LKALRFVSLGGNAAVRFLRILFCTLTLASVIGGKALAQNTQDSASITGTVLDSSGTVITGASVRIINNDGLNQAVDTDERGNYLFDGLPAGTYSVSISAEGFKPFQNDDLVLNDGQNERVDAKLESDAEPASIQLGCQERVRVETESAQWLF
jgi:hypothetical protein